jgi:Protein of unknown function (DUF3592)
MKYVTIIVGFILLLFGAWRYSSLSRHYISAQGTILQLYPMEHQSFEYYYTVSRATYFGTTTAQSLDRDLASIKIGDHLTVYYDTKHPADSTADPPSLRGIMSIWAVIFAGTLFSLGTILWSGTRKPGRN